VRLRNLIGPGRWRSCLALVVLLGVAGAAGLWLVRDLPRRAVERTLSRRLAADVRVGSLAVHGQREVELRQLVVRRARFGQRAVDLEAERVVALGRLDDLARGRIERLLVEGAEVRVGRPDASLPPPAPAPQAEIGRLELTDAAVVLDGAPGAPSARFSLAATVTAGSGGEIELAAAEAPLEPLLALLPGGRPGDLGGNLVEPTLRARFDQKLGTAEVTARATRATLESGGRQVVLDRSSVALGVSKTSPDGGLRLEVEAALLPLASAVLEAELAPGSYDVVSLQGSVQGLTLERLLPLLGEAGRGLEASGPVALNVASADAGALNLEAHVADARLRLALADGAVEARGVVVEATTHLTLAPALSWGPAHVSLVVPELDGAVRGFRLPGEALLATVELDARPTADGSPGVDGELDARVNRLGTFAARGRFSAEPGAPRVSATWSWQGCDLGQLVAAARGAGFNLPQLEVAGRIVAAGNLDGGLESFQLTARTRFDGLSLARGEDGAGLALAADAFAADWRWNGPRGPLTVTLPETSARVSVASLPTLPLVLSGSAQAEAGAIEVEGVRAVLGDLARVAALGSVDAAGAGVGQVQVAVDDLGAWAAVLPLPVAALEEGTLAGALVARLEVSGRAGEAWTAGGELALDGGGFSSADGAHVIAGGRGRFEVSGRAAAEGAEVTASGPVSGLQVLWGTVFADFSAHEVVTSVAAKVDLTDAGPAWTLTAAATPGPRAALEAGFELRPGAPAAWRARLQASDLAGVLEHDLRAPLQGSIAAVEDVRASGSLVADVEGMAEAGGGEARGHVLLSDLRLATTSGSFAVDDLDVDLPFDLKWRMPAGGGIEIVPGRPAAGTASFASVEAAGLRLPAFVARAHVTGDAVELDEPLAVQVLGGTVTLRRLLLAELLRPSRRLEAAVEVRGIDLAEVSQAFALPPLEGAIDGELPRIRLTRDALEVDGGGGLSVFGGTVSLSEIAGSDILSRYPRLRFSARFDGIDLAQVTRTFDFGEVTGIVAGEVRDCELVRGLPVRCSARLQTVEAADVRRTISLKAVNNLAIVGTGSGVAPLERGLFRLFSHYRYQRIGLEMTLADDRFLLRGLERRGDKELFLKGVAPFRIDVVNVEPGRAVSFSSMLGRLRNLDLGAVRTEP